MNIEPGKAVKQIRSGLFAEFCPDFIIRPRQIKFSGAAESAVCLNTCGMGSVAVCRESEVYE
jgi:hypothetical protein